MLTALSATDQQLGDVLHTHAAHAANEDEAHFVMARFADKIGQFVGNLVEVRDFKGQRGGYRTYEYNNHNFCGKISFMARISKASFVMDVLSVVLGFNRFS